MVCVHSMCFALVFFVCVVLSSGVVSAFVVLAFEALFGLSFPYLNTKTHSSPALSKKKNNSNDG